ncbi:hypothetical protein SAMN04488065_1258 [Haloplanus vescus]|uniref:Uncharacterized protein n=2 Tax=Haloplanus vescus TaxID=555874 RepID=A0A1H3WZM4_9EURY|nr:hypothetical protein SAMN04488065_1258 [Haloplanus vescus]
MDVLDRHISNFDQHLEISKESKPTEYDDWIDPEILSIIETISLDYINLDIKELMEETLGESEISPCRSRRIEVNKHILGIKTADKIEEYH